MRPTVDDSQRKAARVVGFVYLFAMAAALTTEIFARAPLIVLDSAAETAHNILARERLFRIGVAGYLLFLATNVALVAALYVILERVNRNLALLAAFMRLIEIAAGVAVMTTSFDVLWLLNSADHLQAFRADQIEPLATMPLRMYHDKMSVTLVFLGVGSAIFGYLWYKSSYIPKVLAVLGVLGSSLLAVSTFAFIIVPSLLPTLAPAYFAPHFVFEVTMGFLLLFKGLPIGQRHSGPRPMAVV